MKRDEKWAVGRRKTSIARVKIMSGTGKITINKKDIHEHLKFYPLLMKEIKKPLELVGAEDKYDFFLNVHGGGYSSQIGAIKHGLSRSLLLFDENYKPILKKAGFLTRDARMVERKKFGRHKARKSTQFSKR